jgi:SAM-dependent methyltransferase
MGYWRRKLKARIPWYGKIAAKMLMSRLPLKYGVWRKLNLFAHGSMQDPQYAINVFRDHFDRSSFERKDKGFVALELGPGDSLLSALVAKAHGATGSYLIDTGAFATEDMRLYRAAAALLRSMNLAAPNLDRVFDVRGVLATCNATYGTRGLRSLRAIPSNSVDFVWSHAVLEHVRRGDVRDLIHELGRVLRPDGICAHTIDLKDHLGGALNNLRIPTRYWEANWMASSGFYTNRIRFSEMVDIFNQGGFEVDVTRVGRWDQLPMPRHRMASEFRHLERDDLLVNSCDVVLRPTLVQKSSLANSSLAQQQVN